MKKRIFPLYRRPVLLVFFIMLFSGVISNALTMLAFRAGWIRPLFTSQVIAAALLFAIYMLIGTVATGWLSRYYLGPISQMIQASERMAKGDFSVRVPLQGHGQMDRLALAFNRMAEQLNEIEMLRDDFISSVSHEFKTPIAAMQGFARQLQRTDLTDAQRAEYAAIIADECQRLAKLSSNILLLSNLQHPSEELAYVPFRLDEQLRACILLLEKQWSAKRLEMEADLQDAVCDLNADLLQEVWMNLLGNAIKFTPDGGRIAVRLCLHPQAAAVEIADTGIGMSPETQRHIFDKFYQGDKSHHREGNGLGLALVRRIVELNRGQVSVESRMGEGSVFRVELPLRLHPDAAAAEE
mgnify:CR=1 FL=1